MAKKERDVSEERTAAASYVINFYQEVLQLTHNYANYMNFMVELDTQHNEGDELSIDMQDAVKSQCNQIRYFVNVSYIHYKSIMVGTDSKIDAQIQKLHDELKNMYIIKREIIKDYVLALNTVLVTSIIKNLLQTSQDIVKQLYAENESG